MTGIEGIVPILLTPFHDDLTIDYGSLRLEVDATLDTGVHGIGIAIGSEIFKLTPSERRQMLRAVVDQVDGRVPVIMNTSAPGTAPAVELAVEAAEAGASRLMIWPPDFFALGPDAVVEHLSRIAEAAGLPIILQDVPQAPISPALALRIAEAVPLVDTIKVETNPTVAQVGAMVAAVDGKLTVLGGAGGGTLVEEYRRGARGTMPFASQAALFMQVWTALETGDEGQAAALIETEILPVSRLGFQSGDMFYHVHKALLCQAGIFRHAHVRPPTALPEAITRSELARLLTRIKTTKLTEKEIA
ncbi:dihydrodipicolinate synthase family protein [Mameliella sediminis]|uniref:dihydrodipicolinate synthase family protein n=1 Tax=Mameliella sediminis TaxID=2836866 RepID=UPI001C4435B8|nr:dihydrodipicolinate synthase family protein [Mameliella sediminis]MBV7396853.1 dihydrodipicolinate synthase family protein [Mameliella sediminis]MBY6116189.1 dihydrodipicolinate synthase family protein [Antarctobacter heliothermus]MBY6146154.1 dihydrodipicolinate synthase family protein [Mameliella alba]MCA0955339.1 dihydrodipicolinate synthase family protein [Mameliella alba]